MCTYLYRLFSDKNHPASVTSRIAYRIAREIGLTPQKSQNWSHKLVWHTRNSGLQRLSQSKVAKLWKSKQSQPEVSKSNVTERPVEPVQKKRLSVVKFCPFDTDRLSDLALHVKQLMGDTQISMKNLCKRTFLNKQWLHDLSNGNQKTVSRLTVVRIADGLDVPPDSLFAYNHYTPKIKAVVMSNGDDETRSKMPLTKQINKLNDQDTRLIKNMVLRLLIAENHESE